MSGNLQKCYILKVGCPGNYRAVFKKNQMSKELRDSISLFVRKSCTATGPGCPGNLCPRKLCMGKLCTEKLCWFCPASCWFSVLQTWIPTTTFTTTTTTTPLLLLCGTPTKHFHCDGCCNCPAMVYRVPSSQSPPLDIWDLTPPPPTLSAMI